jgi:VRR-NUC domain
MTFLEAVPRISERRYQRQVTDYAEMLGWHWWHTLRSEGSPKGWPDLVLIKRPRIVFLEIKAQRTPVTPEQQACINELRACGQECYIVRPSDFDRLTRILR